MNECISSWKSNRPGLVIFTKSTRDVLSPLTMLPSALPRSLRPIWRHDRFFFSIYAHCLLRVMRVKNTFGLSITYGSANQHECRWQKTTKAVKCWPLENWGFTAPLYGEFKHQSGLFRTYRILSFLCKPRHETWKNLSESRIIPTPTSVLRYKTTPQSITE